MLAHKINLKHDPKGKVRQGQLEYVHVRSLDAVKKEVVEASRVYIKLNNELFRRESAIKPRKYRTNAEIIDGFKDNPPKPLPKASLYELTTGLLSTPSGMIIGALTGLLVGLSANTYSLRQDAHASPAVYKALSSWHLGKGVSFSP